MINENNTVNWLQFLSKILPNGNDTKTIKTFLKKHYTTSAKYTSQLIYHKYCK